MKKKHQPISKGAHSVSADLCTYVIINCKTGRMFVAINRINEEWVEEQNNRRCAVFV